MKKFVLLALVIALAACGSDDTDETAKKDAAAEKKAAAKELDTNDLICPQVAILKEAEEVIDGGTQSSPQSFIFKARMKTVQGDCSYAKNGIDIKFDLDIVADSKLKTSQISVPYFIAIVDPNDVILSRKSVTANFDLSKNQIVEVTDPLHVFIPLTREALLAGPDYRVLIGFDLSKHTHN